MWGLRQHLPITEMQLWYWHQFEIPDLNNQMSRSEDILIVGLAMCPWVDHNLFDESVST